MPAMPVNWISVCPWCGAKLSWELPPPYVDCRECGYPELQTTEVPRLRNRPWRTP